MRINVYLSSRGLCSRREADRLIEQGEVTVNGKPARLAMDIADTDDVIFKGKPVAKTTKDNVYILLNKPRGIISTTEAEKKDNIISYIHYPRRIFPVGRLDKDSSGLIILTTDGQIVNKILRSENRHEKEYVVRTWRPFDKDFIVEMASGVNIYNPVRHRIETTKPCKIKKLENDLFSIILTQGLNRQIRRMVKALGNEVIELERVRIMNLEKGDLSEGSWRYIEGRELETLMSLVGENSQNTK
ncbi:MAG TPA: pseudouridine synthase [Bacillota bacterium]|nr:pseudouridine synthase [Bacillota bacterium]HPF42952.1 pseudouridine synthase [Bacillota bacterium]